ncbi:EAL domain-containing protein [Enterococcus sp. N249-2]
MEKETGVGVTEGLYLLCQPIMRITSLTQQTVKSYEVLLRSSSNNRFPQMAFSTFIQSDNNNAQLMLWYAEQLKDLCQRYPNTCFSVNIHPQQLLWQSTWDFLGQMIDQRTQLQIELTEHPPNLCACAHEGSFDLASALAKIKSYGYVLAIDDIGCGQNTLDLVFANLDQIDCLKFSMLPFVHLDEEIGWDFLRCWINLSDKYGLTLIVEGVEDKEKMAKLFAVGVTQQQGYLWSKGEKL